MPLHTSNGHQNLQELLQVGEFVWVEGDRGEDVGVVQELFSAPKFWEAYASASREVLKRIIRTATAQEARQIANDKATEEQYIVQVREASGFRREGGRFAFI